MSASVSEGVDSGVARAVTYGSLTMIALCFANGLQGGEFQSCWGRSTELGEDGIGGTLTGDLEAGEIVTLEIPLPLSPYPLKIRAIVRYRHGLHYGFEFLTLTDSQRETMRRVCEMLSAQA